MSLADTWEREQAKIRRTIFLSDDDIPSTSKRRANYAPTPLFRMAEDKSSSNLEKDATQTKVDSEVYENETSEHEVEYPDESNFKNQAEKEENTVFEEVIPEKHKTDESEQQNCESEDQTEPHSPITSEYDRYMEELGFESGFGEELKRLLSGLMDRTVDERVPSPPSPPSPSIDSDDEDYHPPTPPKRKGFCEVNVEDSQFQHAGMLCYERNMRVRVLVPMPKKNHKPALETATTTSDKNQDSPSIPPTPKFDLFSSPFSCTKGISPETSFNSPIGSKPPTPRIPDLSSPNKSAYCMSSPIAYFTPNEKIRSPNANICSKNVSPCSTSSSPSSSATSSPASNNKFSNITLNFEDIFGLTSPSLSSPSESNQQTPNKSFISTPSSSPHPKHNSTTSPSSSTTSPPSPIKTTPLRQMNNEFIQQTPRSRASSKSSSSTTSSESSSTSSSSQSSPSSVNEKENSSYKDKNDEILLNETSPSRRDRTNYRLCSSEQNKNISSSCERAEITIPEDETQEAKFPEVVMESVLESQRKRKPNQRLKYIKIVEGVTYRIIITRSGESKIYIIK